MPRVGRPSKVNPEELLDVISRRISRIFVNGRIVSPCDSIFKEISRRVSGTPSPKAIYLFIKKNKLARQRLKDWGVLKDTSSCLSAIHTVGPLLEDDGGHTARSDPRATSLGKTRSGSAPAALALVRAGPSRQLLSNMLDIGTLIEVVQSRPCLWDQRCKEYYNRENVARNWEQVGEVLDVNYELAKNKWKHLRDNYRAELKKVIKSATEDDERSRYKSSWVWFDSLSFLKDFVFSKGKKNRQSVIIEEEQPLVTSPVRIKVEPDLNIEYDEPSVSSEHSDTMYGLAQEAEAQRKRKLAYDGEAEEAAKRMRPEVEDDCHHFVLSILPSLRRLPLQNQMLLRAKIYELIYQEYNKTFNEK